MAKLAISLLSIVALVLLKPNSEPAFQLRAGEKFDNPPHLGTSTLALTPLPAQLVQSPKALETCAAAVSPDLTATADLDQRFQQLDGFGHSQRLFDDPHVTDTFNSESKRAAVVIPSADQNKIFKLLYDEMGFTIVRPITDGSIEPTNDNLDPNNTDLSKFDFSWKLNDGFIDYIKRAKTMGLKTYFLSPIKLEAWMDETSAAENAELAMATLRRWKDQGVELPYYSILNEPSYTRSGIRSGEYIRDVIKILGPKMRRAGMITKIVITDDVRATDTLKKSQIILRDPEARQYVGAIATHLYDEPISNMSQLKLLALQYNLPIWMTEFSLIAMSGNYMAWAQLMHDLIVDYNVSAVMYMWGFFGQWDGDRSMLIQINNSGGTYLGFIPQKTLYVMGQFAKFVPPGSTRIGVTYPLGEGVSVSSYSVAAKIIFVVINRGRAKKINLEVSGRSFKQLLSASSTTSSQNMISLSFPCTKGSGLISELPNNSITTYETKF